MALKLQMPEVLCMEPDNYKKYFRALCWGGTRKSEKKPLKRLVKKDKTRKLKGASSLAPMLLGNPSQFAVYAAARRAVLTGWKSLPGLHNDHSDDSDSDDQITQGPIARVPKTAASCPYQFALIRLLLPDFNMLPPTRQTSIDVVCRRGPMLSVDLDQLLGGTLDNCWIPVTGIGLRALFSLIYETRFTDTIFVEKAMIALLDVLQGHAPEELVQEPSEIIHNLHSMLIDVSGVGSRALAPTCLTGLGCSTLIALSVARGEAEFILNAAASLIMSPTPLADQYVQIPMNLTLLQRSVLAVILGPPSRNQWLYYGVPHQSLVTSFPVDFPAQLTSGAGDLVVRSLVSDGCFLYVYTSKGLLKIGSGYGSSIRQHVYLYKPDFFPSERHGWLGYCKGKFYARIGRKKTDIFEIDKNSLERKHIIRLDPGSPAPVESKSAVFTDGHLLGLILLTDHDNLTIRMYDIENPATREEAVTILKSKKELTVPLLRRRTLALGRAPFEDGLSRRNIDYDTPVAVQLDDLDEDPLVGICAGQDFGLLTTASGKVYYTGKGPSLGYKQSTPHPGRWTLIKETLFNRCETAHSNENIKRTKVVQAAVGHEGVHATLVLDSGSALFTGISRRGEDGDPTKHHRRTPKPTRPKRIFKAEGHHIVYAACNYGSTALVTRQGLLLMFGKDTQHCDATGLVTGLRHERLKQVALGKAHAVALTSAGLVYTFGINNKGQCGREFGYTKEKSYTHRRQSSNREDVRICPSSHTWTTDYCRVCMLCRECTGFTSCACANLPNRVPGEKCGCGEGDSGCSACGICRRCAETFAAASRAERTDRPVTDLDDDGDVSRSDRDHARYANYEALNNGSEGERESSLKVSCLPPAKVAVPGGHRVVAIACGLHHTVLLTESDVLTFGSNQFGQLGAGDIAPHHRIVRVRVPKTVAVAAGSNHTAIVTKDGELFTFGSYQKGALGRPRLEETQRTDRAPIWYATPGRVPRIGPRNACKAVWVSASGDQTFVQVSQALIKTDTLFSATITANNNCIVILPNRPEHTFKCITISKLDGTCTSWTGPEQVDFVHSLAVLDPLYDIFWCYQPQMRVMKCYNILAFDSHKLQRCYNNHDLDMFSDGELEYPSHGSMKRIEDFKNMEDFDVICSNDEIPPNNVALSNMSILNQELAIPITSNGAVTRMHAALHLLGCLDSLTYAYDQRLRQQECRKGNCLAASNQAKEDFLTVNRFESHGGGWGYSGHSVEAIRFMCDTDILLGGIGLFGGRGDYTARAKLFDIGVEGGDLEADGELMAETDEIVYECAPRDKFPVLFDRPVHLLANRWYLAWACINGPSSDCGSSGQAMVIQDEIGFHFKTSKKSNNGTDVNAGQIPTLLYNVVNPDHIMPTRAVDLGEPVIPLSKNLSRKVTVDCFKSLITLLNWSWKTFKDSIMDTNGQIPINYKKLTIMKHQKRLVYVIRACLRLVKFYINEIYPQNKKRNSQEYMSYVDAIGEVRNLIQSIMADPTPTCNNLPKKSGKNKAHRVCYVQFALELTNSILKEAHETVTACFHAFFPTPTLKWKQICTLLFYVKGGVVPQPQIQELTATCAAMCNSKSLQDVLNYIVPVTQGCMALLDKLRPECKIREVMSSNSKSATVPRPSYAQKPPPPVPPRANKEYKPLEPQSSKSCHTSWHLFDLILKLLDIVMMPIKQQMMTQCGDSHDHGEIKQHEHLSEYVCKMVARIIAELAQSAINKRDEDSNLSVKHLMTPSRFMRVNQARAWNTGSGSPDAICFAVDRPGTMLVGACVYAGLGNYEYSMELMHDVRLRSANDDSMSHCWVSVEISHGAFSAANVHHDMVQLKFDKPIPLKEDLRYAIRFCNHGGRTANGDCGMPTVTGPDGTVFRFSSCSLSFNGTTQIRGQIPCLIYYSTTKTNTTTVETSDYLATTLRNITLRVSSIIMDRGAELFCTLRDDLTAEDLKRNALVLQSSPVINTLIPYTLAHLEWLEDPKSIIRILDMVHDLLPHVAAMNLLVPTAEELTTTTTHYYAWVESDHPYKQATVSNIRVLFPPNVSWIVLEIDPRSITTQPEDTLTIYAVAGSPKSRCHSSNDARILDPPFRKVYKRIVPLTSEGEVEEVGEDLESASTCMHYNCTYVSVSNKFSNNPVDWPQKALLVPGNEVIFSLETASDYLTEYNKTNSDDSRFGYRCLCVGYEEAPFTTQRQGLAALEMELVYLGANCASRLLAPDLDVPNLTFATSMEVQMLSMMGASPTGEPENGHNNVETLLLSRGLELSSPPTILQVLDGLPLLRGVSTERQFLSDFVAGLESTAGGRLASWLAPVPCVDPTKCELRPPCGPARPGARLTLPILIRDQYSDLVASPALKVEVVVQRCEQCDSQPKRGPARDAQRISVPEVSYHTTIKDTMCFHAITMIKAYQNYSFEELRFASGVWGAETSGGGASGTAARAVPAERLPVRALLDGSYVATWTPRAPGTYVFRCTLDDLSAPQELTLEVAEADPEGVVEPEVSAVVPSGPPSKQRRFSAPYTAGLRVRASPSLQSEEIGCVPPGSNIGFVEEVVNKDGTWLRLCPESVRTYAEGCEVSWCLSHHRHLDKTLLMPVEPGSPTQLEYSGTWSGYVDWNGCDMFQWGQDEDPGSNEVRHDSGDERRFQLPAASIDVTSESDGSSSPYLFAVEPSKRDRIMRNENSPKRSQRFSNGNNAEYWPPAPQMKPFSDEDRDVTVTVSLLETEIEAEPDPRRCGRLTQAGTQTSPESSGEEVVAATSHFSCGSARDGRVSPKSLAREQIARRSHYSRYSRSPPPLPARNTPAPLPPPPPPRKYALCPAQVECLRAVFAAMLWHEGIVHDAIACAAFLKFHPQLPKQGARVVTRHPHEVVHSTQRHSVEVSNAGQYLRIYPSTLETLTRSGEEAFNSRMRKADIEVPIKEEEGAQGIQTELNENQQSQSNETIRVQILEDDPSNEIALQSVENAQVQSNRTAQVQPSDADDAQPDEGLTSSDTGIHSQPDQNAQSQSNRVAPLQSFNSAMAQSNESGESHPKKVGYSQSTTRSNEAAQAQCDEGAHALPTERAQTLPGEGASSSVVNVLPPALRALVALWDTIYDADHLAVANDKFRKGRPVEKNENEDKAYSGIRNKREWKCGRTPYSVRCELCGGSSVPPPLAAHMRHTHPGCRMASTKGYDRAGAYKRADQPPAASGAVTTVCGQLAQAYQLWYIFCEKCREKALRAASAAKQSKTKTVSELGYERADAPDVDHNVIKENAMFLLDLAPLNNPEPLRSAWHDDADDPGQSSPPTPPGSMWQPAPPFQCLSALGAAPKATTLAPDAAKYHSLGRTQPSAATANASDKNIGAQISKVHRSVSMGQAGAGDLASAARPQQTHHSKHHTQDTLTGAGSSLLAQPSAALQRLVGGGVWDGEGCSVSAFEPPYVDLETLMQSPMLTFVLAKRDLHSHRQKMDASIRINTIRQFAFEAMNWLLRSTTQPTCTHDVMWWFCSALDKYANLVPPPFSPDDNKENMANDATRIIVPTASTSAMCPGGRTARCARAALHAFLGSVSALAPSLPPSSAAALQAVRCWSMHYSSHDRTFLHRSQVFSVISRILTHNEDCAYEEGMLGALHESFHSYLNKENYVWHCPDVTGWCEIMVSSRQGMAGSLVDGTTETFWESGDEDRNRSKWIQVSYPAVNPETRPHIVCVHIDNTRDTVNKCTFASFAFSGGSNDMYHMQDFELDAKTAAWLCYTLPRVTTSSVRVRCEMRGPEAAVRVRQVRILRAPLILPESAASPAQILHGLTETDTLRVFRLLTSQVFGKLLEWQRSGSETNGEGSAAADGDDPAADDSDLREHVVGILFAGHKLTSLQRQVMKHIVGAISCEAARIRDDWETALLCAETERAEEQVIRPAHQQDNYCFEMLSLLLALSGSVVGRAHLATRTDLLADLLALLHTGSERVQRQVILLLRRMIMEISPQRMHAVVNYGNDGTRMTFLDHLVCYLGKAITVQVKVKGTGGVFSSALMMGTSVVQVLPATWFMRGETIKKHAHLVAKLLTDMAEEKLGGVWGAETRSALTNYVAQVVQIPEANRQPLRCIASPTIWMALAALCVCEQSHMELLSTTNEGRSSRDSGADSRPFCTNHDDGSTVAVIECRTCGPLCTECDRFLHLNRAARTHHRQICKEEESIIRIDIHEGCGRAKLFWLLLLVDRRTLKALAEFRALEPVCEGAVGGVEGAAAASSTGLAGSCRFCGTRGSSGLLAIGNVCADQQCQEHGREACSRVLGCGHLCGGVRNERSCLPCLIGCESGTGAGAPTAPLRQDADDMCMICFTDPLQAAPAIQLKCGHVFHLHCCKNVLINKWNGPRITFSFSQCPICKEDMEHWTLDELLTPIRQLREEVKRKALMRLEYEGLAELRGARGRVADPHTYAMERYAYYVCHKCGRAYFGGLARCEAETNGSWQPSELACGACSDVAGARTCPKHGADFLEYKCRYCCSVAVFFCFGTSHFCNACHDDFQRVTNIPKHLLPQCPAGPKGEQLPGSSDECPLHVQHPSTGEEFALGCGVCRHAQAF